MRFLPRAFALNIGLALLLPAAGNSQNINVLNDEFENAATIGQWQHRYVVEQWPANQLETFDIDGTQPGRMVMMPYTVTWYQNYAGPLAFKTVTGDFAITTEVHASNRAGTGPPSCDFSLAGIMIRAPRADMASTWTPGHENYVFLSVGRGTTPGWSYETKTTLNSSSALILSPAPGGDVTLQTARIGPAVINLRREPGGPWVVHRRYPRPDLPDTLQAGLVTYTDWPNVSPVDPYTHNSTVLDVNPDLVAGFEYARFFGVELPPELAGLDLTDPVQVSDGQLLAFLGDHADDPVAVGEEPAPGAAPAISAEPNPSGASTRLRFRLPAAGPARVLVLDVSGRRVADFGISERAAGPHTIVWDGRDARGTRVGAGLYLAVIETSAGRAVTRLCRLE